MSLPDHSAFGINGTTRLYGIMGYPIAHSLSPLMQTFALRHCHLDALYMPFLVEPARLAEAVTGALALGVCGWNVTIPHKETIMAYLDEIAPAAQAIGAVNTVQIRDGKTMGYNTDGVGFLQPLQALHVPFQTTAVCLLGAGGAARAVAMALLEVGCAALTVTNRTQERAERLVDVLRSTCPSAQIDVVPWTEAAIAARHSAVIVNSTSVGLHAAGEALLPETCFRPGQIVYDLVYRPLYTPLLLAAQRQGATVIPGLDMLIGQGAVAFQLWTGMPFPLEDVRRLLQPFFTTAA